MTITIQTEFHETMRTSATTLIWRYSDVAFDTGYRDGLSAGRSDFSQGKDYRPEKHDSHEDGARATALRSSTRNSIARGSCEDNEDAFNRKFDS